MRLTFRQGISRYQTDVYATPSFLQKNGDFVDLIVSPDPTVLVFAHKSATYIIEENKTVLKAWGPFTGNATRFLYWDINLLTGALTRGITDLPPIYAATEPTNPSPDQHWFDKTNHLMKVWSNGRWLDKLRVFAASYSSQAIIQPFLLGSQAGENGSFDGGNIVRDSFNKPLRQSDGTFVTSATNLSVINSVTNTVSLETEVVTAMAKENIPKFSFVQIDQDQRLKLARSDDWKSRIIGIVDEDLYISEIGSIVTSGVVRNEQWNWPLAVAGRPIFCGVTGEISLVPPSHGVLQIAGYIFDKNSIFLNIQQVTILDDVSLEAANLPTGPQGIAPAADFDMPEVTGTAPMTVVFKNNSLHGPITWAWDFNSDGVTDSTEKEPTYTFDEPGTYTVKLTAGNEFGTNVKTKVLTVLSPAERGVNTNADIQLSGPLQINMLEIFPVQVVVSNSALLTATNVSRVITIDDIGNTPVVLSSVPTNSAVTHTNNKTTLILPLMASLAPGQTVTTAFSIKAPNTASTLVIRASVATQEVDSEPGDNTTSLSIRVK